jgi:hypothetical protein
MFPKFNTVCFPSTPSRFSPICYRRLKSSKVIGETVTFPEASFAENRNDRFRKGEQQLQSHVIGPVSRTRKTVVPAITIQAS